MGSRSSEFPRPAQRYGDFRHIRITCQAACHGKTEHGIFVKLKNPTKLLSSYLQVSPSRVPRAPGTSPHHLVAEAPKDHAVQVWAIPHPSWGLLSQWQRQETTRPETNGASSARTRRHSQKISRFIRQRIALFYEKGVWIIKKT